MWKKGKENIIKSENIGEEKIIKWKKKNSIGKERIIICENIWKKDYQIR